MILLNTLRVRLNAPIVVTIRKIAFCRKFQDQTSLPVFRHFLGGLDVVEDLQTDGDMEDYSA